MNENIEGNIKEPCTICFESLDSNQSTLDDKAMRIVKCSNCGVECHLRCIGIENTLLDENVFICDPCSNKAKNYHCDICLSSKGYMKQYKSKKYVHVFCGLFSDVYTIEDFSSMKINPTSNIDKVLKGATGKKATICMLCNKKGGLIIKCSNDLCEKNIHLYCAMSNQYNNKISSPDSNDHWSVKITPNVELENSTVEGLNYNEEMVTASENRSGNLQIYCPEHIGPVEYCLCKSSSADDDMICCDYCDIWFHLKCLNMTETNMSKYNNSSWYCRQCTKWLNHKKETMNEVNAISNISDQTYKEAKSQWSNKIIHQLFSYKIHDLIYMGTQYIKRANIVLNYPSTLLSFLEIIITGNSIPFIFDAKTLIKPLNQKLLKYRDINHTQLQNDLNQQAIDYLSFDTNDEISSHHLINFTNLSNDINQRIQISEQQFTSIGFIVPEDISKKETQYKLTWCIKVLNILLNKTSKSNIMAVKELQTQFDFKEKYIIKLNNHLTKISTEYYNWINDVKDLLATHTENNNQLEKYDKEINLQIKREKNEISKLTIKKDKILSHLSIKIQRENIDAILAKGKELMIDTSDDISSIENNCLKPLNEMTEIITKRGVSFDIAKELLKQMISGTIATDDILKEFNEDYFRAKRWEFTSFEVLNEKKIDLLQAQIEDFRNITYISDGELDKLLTDLKKLEEDMIYLKESCITKLSNENDIKELERISGLLKKNNVYGDMNKEIEEKINYLTHMTNIFHIRSYSKNDLEQLGDSLTRFGLNNESIEAEIRQRLELIDYCDNKIIEGLLTPVSPDNNETIFGMDEMKNIMSQVKENNIIIEHSLILDTGMTLWRLNEEYEGNEGKKISLIEEQLLNLIKRHPNLVNQSVNCLFNNKIIEIRHKILVSKATILLSLHNSPSQEAKLCLDDLKIFFEDTNDDLNINFNSIFLGLSEEQQEELKTLLTSFKEWGDNYNLLQFELYTNHIENKDKCKELLGTLMSGKDYISGYLNLNNQLSQFNEIEALLLLNDEIVEFITKNRAEESPEKKPSITQLKASYEEFNLRIKGNIVLKSLSILKEEIIKIDLWLEKYSDFQNKKRKRFYEQIDLSFLEVMLRESKLFICNVAIEQASISTDVSSTKYFYDISSRIISESDPFSHESIQLSSQSLDQLNQIISDLNANKVLISDKNLIENVKTLDWCIRIKATMSNRVDYHIINKLYQEGLLLKRYNEVKKLDYIQEILNQITISKNYKEISDLITKTKQKQISQDEFDSIVSEYESKCRIVFNEEKDTIDSVIKMRKEYETLYENYIKSKAALQDYEKLFNDVVKFPIRLDGLLSKIDDVLVKTKLLQKDVKKLYEQKVKNKLQLTQEKVYSLVEKCKNNTSSFPEGEQLIKAYDTCVENISKLKIIINDPNSDLYEMIGLKDAITIHCNNDDESEINRVIWKRKYEELIVKSSPTQLMIEHLLSEIKEINIDSEEEDNELVKALRELHDIGNQYIEKISQCCSVSELNSLKTDINTNCKVELNEYIVEQETRLNLKLIQPKNFLGQKRKNDLSIIQIERDTQKKDQGENLPEKIQLVSPEINAASMTLSRSKRNVKRKMDKDYFYEKEFVDDFENKIAVRNQMEEQNDKSKESPLSNESQNTNNPITPIIKPIIDIEQEKKEKERIKKIQMETNAKIETFLLNRKTKHSSTATPSQTPGLGNQSQNDPMKASIQKNTILQFENIFKQNPVFIKEGNEFIQTLSNRLGEELFSAYPKIDSEYQKVLSNMLKTVKELEKFRKVSVLVVKGKVTLFKVAKFPYGPKYIQRLKNIEDSTKKKPVQKEEDTFQSLFTGVKELYSSLSSSNKPKEQQKERITSINASLAQDDEDGDNDSLKSLSDKENIRFSPGGGPSKNKALTTSTTIQSTLSPQNKNLNDKNEKIYDPFNNDDLFDPVIYKKKKYSFPIFYDPQRKKLFKETVHPDIERKVPENSILKIWNGNLVVNKTELSNVSFLSTNQYELFEQFPQFNSEIVITNRAKTNEVIPYVEKQLNNKQKLVLYGWLEIEQNNSDKYLTLAEEYDKHDRCACLIVHNIKLYIFSLSPKYQKFNSKLRSECYFYNDIIMSQMEKLLVFVLIANKTDLIDTGKKIVPIVLKRKEITMSQENDNMSPITSEENDKNDQDEEDNDKLEKLLETNDLRLLEEYVNNHFSNLSNTDIAEKLMEFDEERRTKLLMLITQYQMSNSNQLGNNTNEDIQFQNQQQQMDIDDNNDSNTQVGNTQTVQQRIEEVINEEQMRRISQLNQIQMQQNNSQIIPPFYNPQMMSSNTAMYPMMNDYNQMMMHQQQQQHQRHPFQNQTQPQNIHPRYSNNP